jgi:PPM family protein phosphatase
MYYLTNFTAVINSFGTRIGTGFRGLLMPIRQVGYSLQSIKHIRSNIRMPSGFRMMFTQVKRLGVGDIRVGRFWDDIAEMRFEREAKEVERGFPRMAKAEFSQIHFVALDTQERIVVHIGTTIGRSEAHLSLPGKSDKDVVQLRFRQANPQKHGGPIIMEYRGKAPLTVNGESFERFAVLKQGSALVIGQREFRCELYSWSLLPASAVINAGWMTDRGPVNPQNEDAIGIYKHPRAHLFAIADGVGGGEAGEHISKFAIQYLLAAFNKNVKYDLEWNDIFLQAVTNINQEVRRFAKMSSFIAGSTLTAVVIQGWDAHIVHVGDSRLYYWNANTLKQITTDHSKTTKPRDDGTGKQSSLGRTILVKAIGKADTIEPDFITLRLQPGDKLLLSSDGLNERVPLDELAQLMKDYSPAKLPEQLIKLANERANFDNISVIAIDIAAKENARSSWQVTPSPDGRVISGYDPSWSFRLRPPQELITHHPVVTRVFPAVRLLIAGVILVGVILFGLVLSGNRPAILAEPPTATATLTRTPTATHTVAPTVSPTPTFTPQPTIPSPEPTSTLRAVPTSTLVGASAISDG